MAIINFKEYKPQIEPSVFVAPDAWVIGQCQIGTLASIFFHAVLRGDIERIEIGKGTNIQEFALLHTTTGKTPTIVGQYCTIGHSAIIHGCSVGDRCLIGMGAVILDQAQIGSDCIIGANSLVTSGTIIPDGCLVLGSPAKVIRQLTPAEIQANLESAQGYIEKAEEYLRIFK